MINDEIGYYIGILWFILAVVIAVYALKIVIKDLSKSLKKTNFQPDTPTHLPDELIIEGWKYRKVNHTPPKPRR